jgi:hypothetical protein
MECVSPVRCEVADHADLVLFTHHGEHADQASDFTSSCSNKQVGEEIDDFALSIVVLRKVQDVSHLSLGVQERGSSPCP